MSAPRVVVALPRSMQCTDLERGQLRILSRGRLSRTAGRSETLARIAGILASPIDSSASAALRLWGQRRSRPEDWVVAADPVHFETRLRHLVVRAFAPGEVVREEMEALFDSLQFALGGDGDDRFECVDGTGYLFPTESMQAACGSTAVADGGLPDTFTPSGESARAYHRLQGEIQMMLHDHEVNERRRQAGRPAINALWLWGAGRAPESVGCGLPPVFSNDPLYRGYWECGRGQVSDWRGDFAACLEAAPDGFVAAPDDSIADCGNHTAVDAVEELTGLLRRGDLRRLTIVFADGLTADIRRRDLVRFWRGIAPVLAEETIND